MKQIVILPPACQRLLTGCASCGQSKGRYRQIGLAAAQGCAPVKKLY